MDAASSFCCQISIIFHQRVQTTESQKYPWIETSYFKPGKQENATLGRMYCRGAGDWLYIPVAPSMEYLCLLLMLMVKHIDSHFSVTNGLKHSRIMEICLPTAATDKHIQANIFARQTQVAYSTVYIQKKEKQFACSAG